MLLLMIYSFLFVYGIFSKRGDNFIKKIQTLVIFNLQISIVCFHKFCF